MKGEGVNVLLSPGFLLAILNICSKNQANVVFIAKSGSKSFISCLCSLVVAKEFLDAKANTSVVSMKCRRGRTLPPVAPLVVPPLLKKLGTNVFSEHKCVKALEAVYR